MVFLDLCPPVDTTSSTNGATVPSTDDFSNPTPYHSTTFMGSPIDMCGTGRHPILTPHQFQLHGQPVMEVESHKFQKATLTIKCNGPDTIFTFYHNLRHLAQNFNILLLPLEDITRESGTCQLTPTNCLGFDNVRQTMSTALFLKLTSGDYFK